MLKVFTHVRSSAMMIVILVPKRRFYLGGHGTVASPDELEPRQLVIWDGVIGERV